MDTIFTLATGVELKEIYPIYKKAIAYMDFQNINQWDEKYPTEDIIKTDILKQQMYKLLQNKKIVSAIVINDEQDDEYKSGKWKYTEGKIAVIHRLCVHPDFQNQGIGKKAMICAENLLYENNYLAVRLDAFAQNPYALRLYEKLGYSRVGEVNFRKGRFYLYEKLISY